MVRSEFDKEQQWSAARDSTVARLRVFVSQTYRRTLHTYLLLHVNHPPANGGTGGGTSDTERQKHTHTQDK